MIWPANTGSWKVDMSERRMFETMREMLTEAYLHPDRKTCFYSADSEPTGSEMLDGPAAWDWTPQRSLPVEGNSTCNFPLALGCRRIFTSEGTEWAEVMFSEKELLEADELEFEPPDLWSGKSGELLRHIEAMAKDLPEGELIRAVDVQSPFGVAEMMCGSALYMALVMNPRAVHGLLQKITDFQIAFLKEQKRIAGTRLNAATFPYVWHGPEGAYCSDDSLTLQSPQMHAEFSLPYVNRIGEACGPLFYHSCSWREQYFDNIRQVRDVLMVNWNPGNSADPAIIIREFSGSAVLAPHVGVDMHKTEDTQKWGDFADEAEFLGHILDSMRDDTTLYLWLGGMCQKPAVLEEMYRILDERGWSPRARGLS
jgi:hypothetical protein